MLDLQACLQGRSSTLAPDSQEIIHLRTRSYLK
uniref:Uncharacterized protein n=1 Tax=Arundo donax TaxID=35708 RepID=A0A0A9HMU5_ARUDO